MAQVEPGPAIPQEHQFDSPAEQSSRRYSEQASSKKQAYSTQGHHSDHHRGLQDQPAPYQLYNAQPSSQHGDDIHHGPTGQTPRQQRPQSEGNVQQATPKQQDYSNRGRAYSEHRDLQDQPAPYQRYNAQLCSQLGVDDRCVPTGQTPTQQGLQSEGNIQQAPPRQQTPQNTYPDLQGGYHGYQIEPNDRPRYTEQEPVHYGHATQALRHPDPGREPDVCQGFAGRTDINQGYSEQQPGLRCEYSRHAMSPQSLQRAPMAQPDYQQYPDTRPGYLRHSDRRSNRRQTFGNREYVRQRYPEQTMYDYPQRTEQVPSRQSCAGLQHLKNSKPEYPVVNKRAFLILSIVKAVCCLLILVSGVVVAASNKERRSINGTAVGPVSIVYAILGGMSVVFGILNSRSPTECKVITGLVLSILSAAGSVAPAALGATNAVECITTAALPGFWHGDCPSHIVGLSLFLITLSFIVSILAIVHSSFSCRAMCCLPPQRVVGNVSMNNNFEERTTKM